MENGYDKVMGYVIVAVGVCVGFFFLYRFSVTVLPWIILIAVVIAATWLYFWQRSTRRSKHPWSG